jgi:hypothetical protein
MVSVNEGASTPATYTQEQLDQAVAKTTAALRESFSTAANRACDDVTAATGVGGDGARDAFNLLVNATLVYSDDPTAVLTLEDVARSSYNEPLSTILDWIGDL